MQALNKWGFAVQIAAVYIGTVIGAGFATGKEITVFFTQFGLYGLLAICLSGFLFIFFGTKMMEKAIDLHADSYETLNRYLFGKKAAGFVNVMMMAMLFGVCGVMLSGAGAVFEEQLRVGRGTGILLTVLLAFFVMCFGIKGLLGVNTFVVPLMLLFNFLLLSQSVQSPGFIQALMARPESVDMPRALLRALSYAALNLALAQAVLVPVAAEVKDKEVVRAGGILGGLFLTLILISSHLSLVTLPDVAKVEIPMAHIVKASFPGIYFIYVLLIFGEIFTSIIGDAYGLERQMQKYMPMKSGLLYGVIFSAILLISSLHYGPLLSVLYPLFGYFSLVFMMALGIKTIRG